MENRTIKKEMKKFKKEFSVLFQEVKDAEDKLKYINSYFLRYLKPEYEELKRVSRNNLEKVLTLYEDKHLLAQDKEKLSGLLESLIYHYKRILCKDMEYEQFLKTIAIKANISLNISEVKEEFGLFEELFLTL